MERQERQEFFSVEFTFPFKLPSLKIVKYRVALNFWGSLILRIGDFLCFAGTNFCDFQEVAFYLEL